ncbi:MAG: hypothetical protein ACO3N7_08210 [Kiritimatiellia bacterium]
MKANIEDPFWTLYALGDCSEEEKNEAGALLIAHPELAAEVSRLQETLLLLREELQTEPGMILDPLRREAVLREGTHPAKPVRSLWIPTAAAALFAIGLGIVHWRSLPRETGAISVDASGGMFLNKDAEELSREPVSDADEIPEQRLYSSPSAPAPLQIWMEAAKPPARARIQTRSLSQAPEFSDQSKDDFLAARMAEAEPVPTPTPTPTPVPEEVLLPPAL